MARRKRIPEENTRREKIRELLQLANVGSMDDIQELFKDTITGLRYERVVAMKAAQYAKYFIRIILAICAIAIIFTIVYAITPKIDVFSCVGVHLTAEHPRELTYTFNADFFAEQVSELKPKADIRDVEDLANSIQVKLDIIDIIDFLKAFLKPQESLINLIIAYRLSNMIKDC